MIIYLLKKLIDQKPLSLSLRVFIMVLAALLLITPPAFGAAIEKPDKTGIFSVEEAVTSPGDPGGTVEKASQGKAVKNSVTPDSDKDAKKVVSLEDCIYLAFDKHPTLRQSFALREAARAQVVQTRAAFYPWVGFTSSYNRSVSKTTRTNSGVVLPVTVSKTDYYSNRISTSQLIYDFGRTRYRVLSASENLKAAHYDLLSEADGVILAIREAYYQAVAARKALDVQKEAVHQQQLHLKQARGFYEIGRRSKIEVTKAEVDLADAELELIRAENSVRLSRYTLANAIGITGSFDYSLDDQVQVAEVEMDRDKAVQYARTRRPEMLKMVAMEQMNNASLKIAKAAYLPRLNSSGGFGYGDNHPALEDFSWSWGLTLQFDIFTSGERAGAVQEAKQRLVSLVASRDRLWQNIYLEVQDAFLKLEESRKRIIVLEKTLDSARENFALAQGRYEVGLSDNLEFNDARLSLQKAKINLISAILDYQIARARLERATGMTLIAREMVREKGGSPVEDDLVIKKDPQNDKDGKIDGKTKGK